MSQNPGLGTTGDLSTVHHQIAVPTPHQCRQTEPGCYRELTAPLSAVAGAREHSVRQWFSFSDEKLCHTGKSCRLSSNKRALWRGWRGGILFS